MMKRSAFFLVLLAVVASGVVLAEEAHRSGPVLISESRVSPTYPPSALQARLDGVVTVSAQVLADGSVGQISIVETSVPNLGFEEAAQDAVRQWRFEPATLDGAMTEAQQLVRLHFRAGPNRRTPGFVAASFGAHTVDGSTSSSSPSAVSVGTGKAVGAGFGVADSMIRASQQVKDHQGRRRQVCSYTTCAFANVNDIRDRGPKDIIIRLNK